MTQTFAAASASINDARAFVTGYVRDSAASDDVVTRAELIASELVSNAIEATPAPDYAVRVAQTDYEFSIAVTNQPGESEVPMRRDWQPDSALAPKGRGLLIVQRLASRVEVEVHRHQRAVTVTAYLAR